MKIDYLASTPVCWNCGKKLDNKQTDFCSVRCEKQFTKDDYDKCDEE